MFTGLRNNILMLNMAITSAVMIAAFAVIYFTTYSGIHADIRDKLNARSELQIEVEEQGDGGLPDDPAKGGATTSAQFSQDGPLSFDIETDMEGHVLSVDSLLDWPREAYDNAAKTAWSGKNGSSAVTLEGKRWRYAIARMSKQVVPQTGQPYTVVENKYRILFLDVTESERTLLKLLTTLIVVGALTLVVILAVSLYFANRTVRPIAAAWEKQKQFVADASHELKTPISIINANYDALMAARNETVGSQLKWLGYIKIGTDRMTKLINDLLSLARMEDAGLETRKTPFDMSAALNEVLSSMESAAGDKRIALSRSVAPAVRAFGDPEGVKQIVAILFDNAIKYANTDGRIGITLTRTKRQAVLTVTNCGRGISPEDLPKVFDRFYRADPSRTHDNGGYGLGLSIARTIADRLGAEIRAESVVNERTTFTFAIGLP